jgi:two-component system chemotaxis sensor kinase CheA
MVDRIGDPLMHLVRNAIDHGIEPPKRAMARGKPARGTVELHAYHESGSINIEVSDDGGGLDRDAHPEEGDRERAWSLLDAHLSDQEVYRLILAPGFSTAEKVTKLSGRGVGMDVVRSNIEALRGTIDIESVAGTGHDHAPVSAADAGDHRRLPRRRRQLALHHPARHGRRVHRTAA